METLQLREGWSNTYVVEGQPLSEAIGLELLGSGHFSKVYAIDETRVLKVVYKNDSGYARFVSVIRGSKNPHFPKIFYSGVWGGKQVYILERLQSEAKTLNEDAGSAFRDLMQMSENPFVTFATDFLAEASKILRENNLLNDFHSQNLMWRGDIPVVSDPSSF